MYQPQLLRDEHLEPLGEAVYTILEKIGILCQNQELLQALADHGATVDFAAERARFPRTMVTEYVASFRAQNGVPTLGDTFRVPGPPQIETQIAQLYYDWPSRTRRNGSREDLVTLIKLGEVLHGAGGVGHALVCTEVPPVLEPLQAALSLAEYASRPCGVYCWKADLLPYLEEMAAIIGAGPNFATYGAICFAHPLRFDKEPADRFVVRAKRGVTVGLTAMPVAGVTTPVTPEGFIAMSAAEHIAGWICGRVLNPTVPLGGSQWVATVDMRTGGTSYSSPDAMYLAFASIEFLRRWAGVSIPPGSGEYCDAKEPGLAAALEKHYKAMMVAAFTGTHPPLGQGMLECGKTMCPVQFLLERDLAGSLAMFGHELDPSPANIALETMLEVDLGFERNYFESLHTLQNFRPSVWLPELVEREGWRGAAQDEAVLDKAQEKFENLLAQYEKPAVDPDRLAAMRAIMDRAARDFGVTA